MYAFLADGLNNPKWRKGVREISLASGVAGTLGAVYSRNLTGPGNRPIPGDYSITTATPGQELGFQVGRLITSTMQAEVAQLRELKAVLEAG